MALMHVHCLHGFILSCTFWQLTSQIKQIYETGLETKQAELLVLRISAQYWLSLGWSPKSAGTEKTAQVLVSQGALPASSTLAA